MNVSRQIRPDERFDVGPLAAVRRLAEEVWQMRYQARVVFMRDFKTGYTGTSLGVFWNFFLPLLPVAIYVTLALSRLIAPFEHTPAPVAIALNATLWFLFIGFVQIPVTVTKQRSAEAMKTSVPMIVSIVAAFGNLAFETLVRFLLVVSISFFFIAVPTVYVFLLPAVIFFGCMLFMGLGLFLAILNAAAPDVQKVTGSVLGLGIFLSGVIFPLPDTGPLSVLRTVNPFAVFVEASRTLTFSGHYDAWPTLIGWCMASVVVFLAGARVFYVLERRVHSVV
ncbi:MAG TPA: hypothetical protein DF715_05200 [Oceanicaulis sp.]|nr:hypothetical protein [Oceanicaulis sp.]